MTISPKKCKASKGTVQVKSSNNRLQLVFCYGGQRHYPSLEPPDTVTNRRIASNSQYGDSTGIGRDV